ncbi:MAG TPA: response regulator [Phototrophicaceae bacterium]|nr:response regulator [Phototrophicaceae bacterium]
MAKVLIVDDETLTIDMLSSYLSLIGHNPIGAYNGRQMWDKLAFEEPDAILLDIMLPDANGLDLCRKLRENPETKRLPIIMISAWNPPMTKESETAGATGYLAKPINLEKLKNALNSVSAR